VTTLFFVLALLLLLACAFSLWRAHHTAAPTDLANESDEAEWSVLKAKRDEFENDPSLTSQTRESLRQEWALAADTVLSRQSSTALTPAHSSRPQDFQRMLLIALALGLGVYLVIGRQSPEAFEIHRPPLALPGALKDAVPPREAARHPGDNRPLDERIQALSARLQNQPNDLPGWMLLARSHATRREFAEAAQALEKARALAPDHPDVLADLADMLAMREGRKLEGRPTELIEAALRADPKHGKALALAATAAMARGDNLAAIDYWQRLRAGLPADDPDRAQIDTTLQALSAASPPSARSVSPAAPAAQLRGEVQLAPSLLEQLKQRGLPPNAALFVLARAQGGPPMPIAVRRFSAAPLLEGKAIPFALSDADAMTPTLTLSQARQIDLEARVSISGTAARAPEDVSVLMPGVRVGENALKLVIR
jgi:cytochrome c-type biogenesis protein CcmH